MLVYLRQILAIGHFMCAPLGDITVISLLNQDSCVLVEERKGWHTNCQPVYMMRPLYHRKGSSCKVVEKVTYFITVSYRKGSKELNVGHTSLHQRNIGINIFVRSELRVSLASRKSLALYLRICKIIKMLLWCDDQRSLRSIIGSALPYTHSQLQLEERKWGGGRLRL